jgi:hypothetical protein
MPMKFPRRFTFRAPLPETSLLPQTLAFQQRFYRKQQFAWAERLREEFIRLDCVFFQFIFTTLNQFESIQTWHLIICH